jgi:hypothetical protein
VLHDFAQLAADAKAHGASPTEQLKTWNSVTKTTTDLLTTCNRNGFHL